MRTTVSLGVASAMLLWAASALAHTSSGTLESVDVARQEVRIRNGDAYRLPNDFDLSEFKVGQKVQVSWDSQNPSVVRVGRDQFIGLLYATSIRAAD